MIFAGENFIPEDEKYWKEFNEFQNIDENRDTIISGRYKKFNGDPDYETYYDEVGPSRHLTIVFNTFVML